MMEYCCKNCAKMFLSQKALTYHTEKQVCQKRDQRFIDNICQKVNICSRCYSVFSTAKQFAAHTTCSKRSGEKACADFLSKWEAAEERRRKKAIVTLILIQKKANMENSFLEDFIQAPPLVKINGEGDEFVELLEKQERMLKETQRLIALSKQLISKKSKKSSKKVIQSNKIDQYFHCSSKKQHNIEKKKKPKKESFTPSLEKKIHTFYQTWKTEKKKQYYQSLSRKIPTSTERINALITAPTHYADCYARKPFVRRMTNPMLLSASSQSYFYPLYKPTLDTKVYIDSTRNNKAWIRDGSDPTSIWKSSSITRVARSMLDHTITAYDDLISREETILPNESLITWLANKSDFRRGKKNYRFVMNRFLKGIPLTEGDPTLLDLKLITDYLAKNSDFEQRILKELETTFPDFNDLLEEEKGRLLQQHALFVYRFENNLKKAILYHKQVPAVVEESSESEDSSDEE